MQNGRIQEGAGLIDRERSSLPTSLICIRAPLELTHAKTSSLARSLSSAVSIVTGRKSADVAAAAALAAAMARASLTHHTSCIIFGGRTGGGKDGGRGQQVGFRRALLRGCQQLLASLLPLFSCVESFSNQLRDPAYEPPLKTDFPRHIWIATCHVTRAK